MEYYTLKEDDGFYIFRKSNDAVLCMCRNKDIPTDNIDFNNGIIITDNYGRKRKMYKIINMEGVLD